MRINSDLRGVDGCRQPRKTLRPDPYSPHADSFGFPSTEQEGTDTGHHEKVEIHRPCLRYSLYVCMYDFIYPDPSQIL